MTSHVCFWNLRAQNVLPQACLRTPSLYLAQNPPVNLVHATIPITEAQPEHVMTLAIRTSLLCPGNIALCLLPLRRAKLGGNPQKTKSCRIRGLLSVPGDVIQI
jgi:hypothetical protein